MGRPKTKIPLELTEEQKIESIRMAVEGRTIREICDILMVNRLDFYQYRKAHSAYNLEFDNARKEGMEELADDLVGLADDMSMDVQRARLKSDNIKWILSKKKPETYGDRLNLNIETTVDINKALEAAKARVVSSALLPESTEPDPLDELMNAQPIIVTDTEEAE